MIIDSKLLEGSKLPSLTQPCLDDPQAEEWFGDAILSAALRHYSATTLRIVHAVPIGALNRSISSMESNAFLAIYAQWLRIEGGADEMERRYARLFHFHGFEETKAECHRMHEVWCDWRQKTGCRVSPYFRDMFQTQ